MGWSVRFCTVTFALQESPSMTGVSLARRTKWCWLPTIRFMLGPPAAPEGDDGSHSMLPARTSTAQVRSVAKAGASPTASSAASRGRVGSSAHAARKARTAASASPLLVLENIVLSIVFTPGTFRFVTVPRRPRRRGGEGALPPPHRKTGGKGITRRVSLPGTGTRRGRAPSAPPFIALFNGAPASRPPHPDDGHRCRAIRPGAVTDLSRGVDAPAERAAIHGHGAGDR